MKSRSVANMFTAACVAAASAAHALPLTDKASVELFAGSNLETPGSFHAPDPAPVAGTVYEGLGFKQAYDNRFSGGAEFDYAIDSHLSTFARAAYSQFNGTSREVGAYFSDTAGRVPVNAKFDDTDSKEFDVGARYTFSGERVHPFVGAALGTTYQSSMFATFDNVSGDGTTRVELGRAGAVFQQRLETGLQFSPMPSLDLRLTAAASHIDGSKRSDDPNLALVGLDGDRGNVPGRWQYPAEIGAVWHF